MSGSIVQFSSVLPAWIALVIVISMLLLWYNSRKCNKYFSGRVLLVTSHPDDECMFYGPMLSSCARSKDKTAHILCLSKGLSECAFFGNVFIAKGVLSRAPILAIEKKKKIFHCITASVGYI